MKRIILTAMLPAILLATSSCVQPTGPTAAEPTPERPDRAEIDYRTMSPAELETAYAALLDYLLPGMGADKLVDREEPQQKCEQVCFRAARPRAKAERVALCRVMLARLGPETPQPARVWLLRQLVRLSGEESVPRLTELLDDEDAHIRELARRALQHNRAASASEPLRAALDEADDPAWRVAMINALAARGDLDSIPRFAELAQSEDADIAAAAIAALGDLGGHAGSETLYAIWRGENDVRCELAAAALLRVADGLLERGERLRAGRLFRDMYDSSSPPALRIAALRGLVACEQLAELPTLLDIIRNDDDPRMRQMAARLLEEIPGEVVTLRIQRRLEAAPPAVQAVLIDVLAARGAKTAKPAIIETLGSDDEEVRVAALRALQDLGDASDVVLIATAAVTATGSELDAARTSLARLRGADVGVAILFTAQGDHDPAVRVELIRALAARHYKLGVVQLFEIARDQSEAVRAAVFEALRDLAAQTDLPQMISLLVVDTSEQAREAAEDAVVAICLRDDDHERRAVPVLAVLDAADGTGRAVLIRVLGRLGGADALTAIRAALEDEDEIIVDAAVRALSDWEDDTVLDDLWQIARQSPRENHRVLALRGCMRLLRLPNERTAGQTLELLKEAISLAQRDEERRLVLGAVSDVRTRDALEMARPYLAEETLRDEAAVAMVAIARSLAGEHLEIALSAIDEVLAAPVSETALKQANEAVELIERFEGYVGTWLYAGPYLQEDMSYDDVFAEPFPPEAADAESVAWEHLAAARLDNPWLFDLTKVVSCNDCCLYARIAIWSEAQQPARLEIGSDDGVKAWLGGELVHENPVHRGLSPGRDKVDVSLEQGWNTLLLKIVQRRGSWGFACGVRAPDGQPLPGLKFKAE